MSVGFLTSGVTPSIPTIEELQREVKIIFTSGQIRRVTSYINIAKDTKKFINEWLNANNRAVLEAFTDAYNDIVNVMLPMVPVDTGRLRAGFLNALIINISSTIIGDAVAPSTIEFDLAQLLSEVPYARYHISEFTGREFSIIPSTAGTRPLDMIIISDRLRSISLQIAKKMEGGGWNTRLLEVRDMRDDAQKHLSTLLDQNLGMDI